MTPLWFEGTLEAVSQDEVRIALGEGEGSLTVQDRFVPDRAAFEGARFEVVIAFADSLEELVDDRHRDSGRVFAGAVTRDETQTGEPTVSIDDESRTTAGTLSLGENSDSIGAEEYAACYLEYAEVETPDERKPE